MLTDQDTPGKKLARRLAVALGTVAVVAAAVLMIQGLTSGKRAPPQQITKLKIVPDTPPPPPPPKEEKRPEPPKEAPKEIKIEQPKQEPPPRQAQQNEPLKMEGEAGDGPSPFAAGTVKHDYIGQPTGEGGSGNRLGFAFYTTGLQRHLQGELAKDKKLRATDYRVLVRLWLARNGAIDRVELGGSTGDTELDDRLQTALQTVAAMPEPPPENMPQPVRLRITNRSTG